MNDSHVDPIQLPEGTIAVVPTSMDYVYEHINGQDVICLLMDTRKHGPMLVALTPDTAQHVAAHLQGMLGELNELRQRYTNENS